MDEFGTDENYMPESRMGRRLQRRTGRIPSSVFLWAAGSSIVGSLAFYLMGRRQTAQFVGQWAPTLLILGTYNKLVRQQHGRM
jgi:hypothetical protein